MNRLEDIEGRYETLGDLNGEGFRLAVQKLLAHGMPALLAVARAALVGTGDKCPCCLSEWAPDGAKHWPNCPLAVLLEEVPS